MPSKKLKEIKDNLQKEEREQKEERFFGASEDKLIRIKLNGDMSIEEVKIDRDKLPLENAQFRQIQKAIIEAHQVAVNNLQERVEERIKEVTKLK